MKYGVCASLKDNNSSELFITQEPVAVTNDGSNLNSSDLCILGDDKNLGSPLKSIQRDGNVVAMSSLYEDISDDDFEIPSSQ